jgi:hypothetical protein
VLAFAAAGCRSVPQEPERERAPITAYESPLGLARRFEPAPTVPLPARVAIVMVEEGSTLQTVRVRRNVDAETIALWCGLVGRQEGVADVDFLPEIVLPPDRDIAFDAVRLAAAGRQCRLVFVVRSQRRLVQLSNAFALGYVTVVGALFIPGTDCLAQNRVEAVLVDTVTGHTFADMLVTGEGKSWGPLYFVNTWRARALRRATEDAVARVREKLPGMFGAVKAAE